MGLFKNIGKAIGKVAGTVGNVAGKVLKTAAPIVSVIPGVGSVVAGAASIVGEVLSPTKQEAIVQAVARDGEVKVDKIETTIANDNPTLSATQLAVATKSMVDVATSVVPSATINDKSAVVTEISFMDKAIQWIKKNIILVGLGVVGIVFLTKKDGNKRSYRRY